MVIFAMRYLFSSPSDEDQKCCVLLWNLITHSASQTSMDIHPYFTDGIGSLHHFRNLELLLPITMDKAVQRIYLFIHLVT